MLTSVTRKIIMYLMTYVDGESVTVCEYLDLIDYVGMGNTEVTVSVQGQSDGECCHKC